jgi:hypothetical protein
MKSNHTPGPLIVCAPYTDRHVFPIGYLRPDNAVGIIGEANSLGGTEEQCKANAVLWAASPDLVEALRVMLIQFPYKDGEGAAKYHAWNMGHEAIAKAGVKL